MDKVTIIIAPKQPQQTALVPGRGLILLDQPANPGFKAWVKGDPTIWEWGRTRTDIRVAIEQRAEHMGFEIETVEYQDEPEM